MTNNETLHLIRSTLELNDDAMTEIFALADFAASLEQITGWSKKDGDKTYLKISDTELALFLNGFINHNRGRREGEQPKPVDQLNNNKIFQKLRIALDLHAEDILEVFQQVDIYFSKHEISAFFRKPGNKHYRECSDNTLKMFITGYGEWSARKR
ncbi:hypothetical protein SIN8267_00168 [Sinobacterium norvegicum]|uniref:DUF1456 family protein n=1 Tax=Sinobacterium norvegicum TaxID=1641715 RepID=A0ABM9AB36_9GAMM|nr:DUF1456 family protein [Sinobacterium norvegicum]CAH0990085.1 hypothetical protein SIN8267_00168 [Sinobacterium norvegicum]